MPPWFSIDTDTRAASVTGGAEMHFRDVDPGVITSEMRILEMNVKRSHTGAHLPPSHQPCCSGWIPAEGDGTPRSWPGSLGMAAGGWAGSQRWSSMGHRKKEG